MTTRKELNIVPGTCVMLEKQRFLFVVVSNCEEKCVLLLFCQCNAARNFLGMCFCGFVR
jgi:hypothetical protein